MIAQAFDSIEYPTYTPEFRLEEKLVTEYDYSIREASEAMNVSKGSTEDWVSRL